MSKAPLVDLRLAPPLVEARPTGNGGVILSSPTALATPSATVSDMLHYWAQEAPERTFLAERDEDGGWRTLDYSHVLRSVRSLGQALIELGLDAEHPVMLLSGNSIDNALVQLAAMEIGVPVAPISPAYSLLSADLAKVRYIHELLTPGLVYAADGSAFERALQVLAPERSLVSANPRPGDTVLSDLLGTPPGEKLDRATGRVEPDTVAKVLFTSGSTGMPKGVKNTQRMLCSNQQAIVQLWPFLRDRPPVILDWLPWSHTFGGNHNFNMMLFNGGSLYIDGGKPAPGLFETTVANLRDVRTTMHFNVPAGFAQLIPHLQSDGDLRTTFFADLDVLFYAAAALPQNLWEQLEELSSEARGARVRMLSAWGSTETSPMASTVHFTIERAGVIGLPAPGTEIKLAPIGKKLELRVKGPNVTPGYWRQPELTESAFDEDGYFKMGDAGRLADPGDASKGIVFDGRIAENFKLASGTWINVGELRVAMVAACAPLVLDMVLTGHDRGEIGVLVFPNLAACQKVVPRATEDTPVHELLTDRTIREAIADGLRGYNRQNPSSSRRVARALLMAEPPKIDANEITDKGYLNQRAVLDERSDLVEQLHAEDGGDVLVIDG